MRPGKRSSASYKWHFRVYVAGQTATAARTVTNLETLLAKQLADTRIEVIDLRADPERAVTDGILAIPTVLRVLPEPTLRVIGDLSNAEAAKSGLMLPKKA